MEQGNRESFYSKYDYGTCMNSVEHIELSRTQPSVVIDVVN